jgi:hypothetical protein
MNGTTSAAPVPGEVDEFHGLFDAAKRRIGHGGRRTRQRDHRTIVVGIRLPIEQRHVRHPQHDPHDGVNGCGDAPLGEIRHALYQLSGHV